MVALAGAGVILVVLIVARPDPITWAMRIAFARDATVSALTAPPQLGAPVNLLVVASDAREDIHELGGPFGELSGARADVILLVRVEPDSLLILQIPRDLRIETPGRGVEPIATTLDGGGANTLVRSVRDTLGVPVHHFVEIGFAGFVSLVDGMGGVALSVPFPLRDTRSGLDLPAGARTLDGAATLAYLRARDVEELREGEWQQLPDDDLARIRRQQSLIGAILAGALDEPPRLQRWLEVARENVRADPTFTVWNAFMVRGRVSSLDPEDVSWIVLPVTTTDPAEVVSPFPPEHVGGRYWLELDRGAAAPVLAELRGDNRGSEGE